MHFFKFKLYIYRLINGNDVKCHLCKSRQTFRAQDPVTWTSCTDPQTVLSNSDNLCIFHNLNFSLTFWPQSKPVVHNPRENVIDLLLPNDFNRYKKLETSILYNTWVMLNGKRIVGDHRWSECYVTVCNGLVLFNRYFIYSIYVSI